MDTPHQIALNKAKIALMRSPDSAFFSTVCFNLKHVWDDAIPTAATNGTVIKFNPQFFMGLSAPERVFLMLHETMHCAYLHMDRLGKREHAKWNVACDHVINLMLIERGFKMPGCGLADRKYLGMGSEEVYALLPEQDPNDTDMDIQQAEGPPDELVKAMQDILVQAAMQSKIQGDKPGSIPGDIQVYLDTLLQPKLPWHRILQKYLHSLAKDDYSYRKFNRRFFPQYYLPSLYSEKLIDIAVAVDISGSVTDIEFQRFVSETHSILKMMKPDKLTLVQFDTEIKSVHQIRSINELLKVEFKGRGGTWIDPVLNWVNKAKPQLLLVFSDGGFNFSSLTTKVDTVWLIHDNPHFTVPFGKLIQYSIKE